jgi:hypothetical protein
MTVSGGSTSSSPSEACTHPRMHLAYNNISEADAPSRPRSNPRKIPAHRSDNGILVVRAGPSWGRVEPGTHVRHHVSDELVERTNGFSWSLRRTPRGTLLRMVGVILPEGRHLGLIDVVGSDQLEAQAALGPLDQGQEGAGQEQNGAWKLHCTERARRGRPGVSLKQRDKEERQRGKTKRKDKEERQRGKTKRKDKEERSTRTATEGGQIHMRLPYGGQ